MIKVEIFEGNDINNLQKKINKWLELEYASGNFDILNTLQTSVMASNLTRVIITITFLYEDNDMSYDEEEEKSGNGILPQ